MDIGGPGVHGYARGGPADEVARDRHLVRARPELHPDLVRENGHHHVARDGPARCTPVLDVDTGDAGIVARHEFHARHDAIDKRVGAARTRHPDTRRRKPLARTAGPVETIGVAEAVRPVDEHADRPAKHLRVQQAKAGVALDADGGHPVHHVEELAIRDDAVTRHRPRAQLVEVHGAVHDRANGVAEDAVHPPPTGRWIPVVVDVAIRLVARAGALEGHVVEQRPVFPEQVAAARGGGGARVEDLEVAERGIGVRDGHAVARGRGVRQDGQVRAVALHRHGVRDLEVVHVIGPGGDDDRLHVAGRCRRNGRLDRVRVGGCGCRTGRRQRPVSARVQARSLDL